MYYDYHTHTSVSEDAFVPADEMIQAAIDKGVAELAITDHFDPDYPHPDFTFEPNLESYHKMLLDKEAEYQDKIKIVKGIEIGLQRGSTLKRCKDEAHSFNYDFIIGSFHCFDGFDLYMADYDKMNQKEVLPNFYKCMYDCLSDYKDYSVLGHFNVIDRYIPFEPDYRDVMDLIKEILKMIISDGKGMEFNTSSYRYGMGENTTPSSDILKMYHELGGEIITIGSDAHKPEYIAMDFDKAKKILNEKGFKYFATFENMKPSMRKL